MQSLLEQVVSLQASLTSMTMAFNSRLIWVLQVKP